MGDQNTKPRTINGAPGVAGELLKSGGPGVVENWGRAGLSSLEFTANKLLQGAGLGANPTEIDVPTGATKEFFAPATYGTTLIGYHNQPAYRIDTLWDEADTGFYVPHDFTNIVAAVVVLAANATATHRLDFKAKYGAVGETHFTHSESITDQDLVLTINIIYEKDISGILTSLAVGDHVGVEVERSSDINSANVTVLGVRFRYS